MIVFDLESGPLAEDELRAGMPPFDESEVKLGNVKDETKIKVKLATARAEYERQYIERAALSPLTGQVLVIGYHSTDTGITLLDSGEKNNGGEAEILCHFWHRYEKSRKEKRLLVGHNIAGFDIPFIVRRSWLLGLDVPATVFERGRYLNSLVFADTMQLWACGGRDPWVKLDVLSKAFGGNGKPQDENGEKITGGQFAGLWRNPKTRAKAEQYLRNDLEMTAAVASRMGLL